MTSNAGDPGARQAATARPILCPTCRRPTVYDTSNPHRPFCSDRCRGMDFGAWASEDYRIGTTPEPTDDEDESRS